MYSCTMYLFFSSVCIQLQFPGTPVLQSTLIFYQSTSTVVLFDVVEYDTRIEGQGKFTTPSEAWKPHYTHQPWTFPLRNAPWSL